MSDFDRNATTAEYGRPLTRAEAAVVDAGLRAYMLRVYNYMVIGLAITGFAALGAYMLSVTGDAASAAKVLRGGAEIPAQIRAGMYLTPLGHALYMSPLKWLVILEPLGLVFFQRIRLRGCHRAKAACPRAPIARDHHRGRALAPAFPAIRALRAFANRVQTQIRN